MFCTIQEPMNIEKIFLETVDSTNSFAKRMKDTFDEESLTIIQAKEQTGGRGRFSRVWQSPASLNLLVTFSLFLPASTPDLFRIGQLFALSTFFLLKTLHLNPKIKWPNDLLIGGKKIGGILTEMQQMQDQYQVILGLGLNVNTDKNWLSSIEQAATSLLVETKKTWDLEFLTDHLTSFFLERLSQFQTNGFKPFQKEYISQMAFLHETIKCGQLEGTFETLDEDGALILRLKNGSLKKIIDSDVSNGQ